MPAQRRRRVGELISVHVIPRPHGEVERILPVNGRTGLSPTNTLARERAGSWGRVNRGDRSVPAHAKPVKKEQGRMSVVRWSGCQYYRLSTDY